MSKKALVNKYGSVVCITLPPLGAITLGSWGVKELFSLPAKYAPITNGELIYPMLTQSTANTNPCYFRVTSSGVTLSNQGSGEKSFSNVMGTTFVWLSSK